MIVKRIADLEIKNRDFITAIIGNTDDVFIDNDLCRYTFEEQLHLYLKNEGYRRVYFIIELRNVVYTLMILEIR